MTDRQRARRLAGQTQIAASVHTGVCPVTLRNFERFGPDAVADEVKRGRLVAYYDALIAKMGRRSVA